MTELQRFIQRNCATYASNGRCLLDCQCAYFSENGGRCNYAETSVIPSDLEIERKYWAERGNSINGNFCEECRAPFERRSNRQKYCASCSVEIRQLKQRKHMREKRWSSVSN
jgi:hypothetical protein